MKKAHLFFLIDPTLDPGDQERIAYAQDVFISRTIWRESLSMCDGPIGVEEGKCEICQAPTLNSPHPYKEDMIPFSSSFDPLPDLMRYVLCEWTVQDIRLLGAILRLDNPLVVAQDIIHVYQKRHPWGITGVKRALVWRTQFIESDFVRSLAQDVYFVSCRNTAWLPERYTAQLVIGRVAALIELSTESLSLGDEDCEEQWISFPAKHVSQVLIAHPEWNERWIAAWYAFMKEMKRQEREEQEEREGLEDSEISLDDI